MNGADAQLADAIVSHQLDLFRLEAFARAQALDILDRLGLELESRLRRTDLTAFNKARIESLLTQATGIIDNYYTRISDRTDDTLSGVAEVQANVVVNSLNLITVGASLPSDTFLSRLLDNTLIQGAKSADWWEKQSADTAFRFATAVRQGLVSGETNAQIVSRVVGTQATPGIMVVSSRNARSLVHTSIQAVANAARSETYAKNNDVIDGVRQVSTLDGHTTDVCIAYDGAEFTLDGEPMNGTELPYNGGVPRHWGCRSVEVPITKTFKELGINTPEPPEGERASADGPVSETFSDFLDRKGVDFQDEVLGKGRAELWRDGTISLQQLLDLKGNPLSLAELKAKYA
jgi:hypothetical protein